MKILLVGSGGWGFNHLRTLVANSEVSKVYVADLNEETLKKVKTAFPDVEVSKDYRDFLHKVDGVIVATPAETHVKIALEVIERKLPVLIEKPIALTEKEARKIIERADKNNVPVVVGHLLLYHPAVIKIKELVKNEEIGAPYYMYSQRLNLGKIRRFENVMWSLAPHDVSIALYVFEKKPLSVRGYGRSFIQKDREIEDVAFLDIEFEGGILAHIHVSWLDPHKVRLVKVVGSEKMVVFDDMAQEEKLKIYNKGVDWDLYGNNMPYSPNVAVRYGDIFSPRIPHAEPLKEEHRDFIESIRTGREPVSSGILAVEITRILENAERSMRRGGERIKLQ